MKSQPHSGWFSALSQWNNQVLIRPPWPPPLLGTEIHLRTVLAPAWPIPLVSVQGAILRTVRRRVRGPLEELGT